MFPVNLLYAANNGPTSPEAASFEPVDAADMVNLATGDLSYSLPALNVPSPEGGYSMALSYHAGIAVDQEASWVGLGWSLNPGAINRSVTGVPDDWKQEKINQIMYDKGGEATSYTGSVSVGWGGAASAGYSVGLYASYAENKTFGGSTSYSFDGGVAASMGLSKSESGNSGLGIGGSIGTNGASAGLNAFSNQNGSGGLSVNQSFKDGSSGVGANFYSLGVSFSSGGGSSLSLNGRSFGLSSRNLNSGLINASNKGFDIPLIIPIISTPTEYLYVNLTFGYHKIRYWAYESNYTQYTGSLYSGNISTLYNNANFPNNLALDSYNSTYKQGDDELEEDTPSNMGYDYYSASGQGISGSFKPAIFEQGSLLNNYVEKSGNNANITHELGGNNFSKTVDNSSADIHFYFENEVSSYLNVSSGGWSTSNVAPLDPKTLSPQSQQVDSSLVIDGVQYNGYNSSTGRKRTGSVIESFTNNEIVNANSTNIIKPESLDRSKMPQDGIGAFRITTVDGKTYHYSTPVYQKQQFVVSTHLEHEFANRFYQQQQLVPYATHWLLTAITGPDYIDLNNNNLVDDTDYGYWVSFNYGKWSDSFAWSTPVKKNDKIKSYEWGIKELYYLDKIKTRTHTALFVKSVRNDDTSYTLNIGNSPTDMSWKKNVPRSYIRGKDLKWYYYGIYDNLNILNLDPYDVAEAKYGEYINIPKHRTLKLDKIVVLKNEDANAISKNSGQSANYSGQITFKQKVDVTRIGGQYRGSAESTNSFPLTGEAYNDVYDSADFANGAYNQKVLKSIVFDYDQNPLAKGARNSQIGRLTLQKVSFLGKSNVQLIPPYKFGYKHAALMYNANQEDNWGYYKSFPDAWSLNQITTPTGASINITYEADDIDKEAVPGYRGFDSNLEFVMSKPSNSNQVYLQVRNEYNDPTSANFVDFTKCFQIGPVKFDMWAAFRHEYRDGLLDGADCEVRKISLDIKPTILETSSEITAVTQNSITIRPNSYEVYESNGGFNWFNDKTFGLKNHNGMIQAEVLRGGWAVARGGCDDKDDRLGLVYSLIGNLGSLSDSEKNGGGVRVKEINLSDNTGVKQKTKYFYNAPGYSEIKGSSNYKSSGVTSYVPQRYFKEIKYRTELPSPYVMYEYVTVKNYSGDDQLGTVENYNFNVLKQSTSDNSNDLVIDDILEITKDQSLVVSNASSNSENYNLNFSKYTFKDMTSSLGRLKEKKVSNSIGQLLLNTRYTYQQPFDVGIGVNGESFNTYKRISKDGQVNYRLSVTSKINMPSILGSVSTLGGGYLATQYIDRYDFLTGAPIETRNISSDNKTYKSKVVPAYVKYSGMGSKADNISNKNMLTQIAAEYSYILDQPSNTWKETGVGITTWNNIWTYRDVQDNITATNSAQNVWRKHKSYTWNGVKDANGIFSNYSASTDDDFNWQVGVGQPSGSKWKQLSEITFYDHYSAALETKDINSNYASVKKGDNDTKVVTTGNARQGELYYTGGEYLKDGYLDTGFALGTATLNSTYIHTGKNSIATTNSAGLGVTLRAGQHRTGRYKLSVWVHKTNAAKARVLLNNNIYVFNEAESVTAGNWVLKTFYTPDIVDSANAILSVRSLDGTTVYFDDLRICPLASSMTSYVYNESDQLTHVIGANGLSVKYVYDEIGRLKETYIEVIDDVMNNLVGGFKKVSTSEYHYNNL